MKTTFQRLVEKGKEAPKKENKIDVLNLVISGTAKLAVTTEQVLKDGGHAAVGIVRTIKEAETKKTLKAFGRGFMLAFQEEAKRLKEEMDAE